MNRYFSLLLAAALPFTLSAEETPTITVKKTDQIAVAIANVAGPEGAAARKILENDLALVGTFTVVEPGRASYLLDATAAPGSLQGKATDRSGGTLLSKSYAGGRTGVHQFVDDLVETLTGKPGFLNTKIAFVSSKSGHKEIYVCDVDGSGMTQLTHDGNISVGPNLGPGGRLLSYTGYKSGYADVYVVDLASGSRSRVVKFPGTNTGGAFSPNGNQMAVTVSRDGNPELYVVGTNGGGARRLTTSRGGESSATWSPDGGELIYSSDDRGTPQLYRISSSGGNPTPIQAGYNYCTEPSWSPDGSKVAFNVRSGGVFQVAVLDLRSGASRTVTSGGDAEDPSFGRDSRHIVFAQGNALYLLDSQTGRSVKVLDGMGKISEPSWSR